MKLSEIESRLVMWYLASVRDDGAAIKLRSPPGRGKSSVLRLLPGKLNAHFPGKRYGMVVVNGATVTLTTATGYLMPETRNGVSYSEFTRPYWWTTPEGKPLEAYDGGVIVIDEDDKLGLDEKKLFGEAALSKILGNHRLPPGWVVWFSGNYANNRSGSTKELDHLILRQREIPVTDDLESLLDWMERNGALPEVNQFAKDYSQIVFMDAPEKQGPYCTPRTLMQADGLLQTLMAFNDDKIPTDPLTIEEVGAGIGKPAAASLFTTIKLGQELPDFKVIVANPSGVHVPSKPDARRLAAYKLAFSVDDKTMPAVITYVKRMPEEFQVMFGKAAAQRSPKLAINPAFAAWARSKTQLIELMAKLK